MDERKPAAAAPAVHFAVGLLRKTRMWRRYLAVDGARLVADLPGIESEVAAVLNEARPTCLWSWNAHGSAPPEITVSGLIAAWESARRAAVPAAIAAFALPPVVVFDRPLDIPSGVAVDFTGVAIKLPTTPPRFLVRFDGVVGASVANLAVDLARHDTVAVGVRGCTGVSVAGLVQRGGAAGVMLRGGNESVEIRDCDFEGIERAGVSVQGANRNVVIRQCRVAGSRSASNWAAGIVLAAVPVRDPWDWRGDFHPDGHWARAEPIETCLAVPARVAVADCVVRDTRAGGIYLDGAIGCLVRGNRITATDKEGMCLDIGCAGCVIEGNRIERCGARQRQTGDDLARDFVARHGRLCDGAARCALPGISLDNAFGNRVTGNRFIANAGGAIKLVRTAFQNTISANRILAPRPPADPTAWHLPGILLDGLPPDVPNHDMDFLPSRDNVIAGNVVVERWRGPGMLLGKGCTGNLVTGNRVVVPVRTGRAASGHTAASGGMSRFAVFARHAGPNHISGNITRGAVARWWPVWSKARGWLGAARRRWGG